MSSSARDSGGSLHSERGGATDAASLWLKASGSAKSPGSSSIISIPEDPALVTIKKPEAYRSVVRLDSEGRRRWVGDPGIGPVFLVVSTEVAGLSCSLLGSCI